MKAEREVSWGGDRWIRLKNVKQSVGLRGEGVASASLGSSPCFFQHFTVLLLLHPNTPPHSVESPSGLHRGASKTHMAVLVTVTEANFMSAITPMTHHRLLVKSCESPPLKRATTA